MSDFAWALGAMKDGHAVRRGVWRRLREELTDPQEKPTLYTRVELYSPAPGWRNTFAVTLLNGEIMPFPLLEIHVLADDWELDDDEDGAVDEKLREAAHRMRETVVRK